MTTRRNFLKLGALFVPAAVLGPRIAYSFIRDNPVAGRTGHVIAWHGDYKWAIDRGNCVGSTQVITLMKMAEDKWEIVKYEEIPNDKPFLPSSLPSRAGDLIL